ncbi:hypothetical protein [Actinomadura roseirufa]|uniref:hypothetical protein n=1 Tax=Actinomadura roseirufa TaxID=2094049 RepID=UPI0010412680|nr:hypothetical protein [Actinomadura roseirufa]
MGLLWILLIVVGAMVAILNGPVARLIQRKRRTFTTGTVVQNPVINRVIIIFWGLLMMGISIHNLLS